MLVDAVVGFPCFGEDCLEVGEHLQGQDAFAADHLPGHLPNARKTRKRELLWHHSAGTTLSLVKHSQKRVRVLQCAQTAPAREATDLGRENVSSTMLSCGHHLQSLASLVHVARAVPMKSGASCNPHPTPAARTPVENEAVIQLLEVTGLQQQRHLPGEYCHYGFWVQSRPPATAWKAAVDPQLPREGLLWKTGL